MGEKSEATARREALEADAQRMDAVGNPGRAAELRAAAAELGTVCADSAPKGRRTAKSDTAAGE